MINPFSNISNIVKQAKDMQQKLQQVQEQLAATHINGEAGAGMVQLTINGKGEALGLKIDDSVYQEDKRILQGLLIAAINDANHKRELKKKEVMSGLMAGMGLPPELNLEL
jgi:DNA-binding YbaB/EbfC family protein